MFLVFLSPSVHAVPHNLWFFGRTRIDGISQLCYPAPCGLDLISSTTPAISHEPIEPYTPYLNEGSRMSDRGGGGLKDLVRTLSRGRIGVIVAKRDTKRPEIG